MKCLKDDKECEGDKCFFFNHYLEEKDRCYLAKNVKMRILINLLQAQVKGLEEEKEEEQKPDWKPFAEHRFANDHLVRNALLQQEHPTICPMRETLCPTSSCSWFDKDRNCCAVLNISQQFTKHVIFGKE